MPFERLHVFHFSPAGIESHFPGAQLSDEDGVFVEVLKVSRAEICKENAFEGRLEMLFQALKTPAVFHVDSFRLLPYEPVEHPFLNGFRLADHGLDCRERVHFLASGFEYVELLYLSSELFKFEGHFLNQLRAFYHRFVQKLLKVSTLK